MNGIAELDTYIRLKDLELEHPHTDKIPLSSGRLDCPDEYVFGITRGEYRKLEQVRGDYNFEFGDTEYPCNIIALTNTQVRLRIEGLCESPISGAIKVDLSNIIERERWGLSQLTEERNQTKRHLLFGNREISGAEQSEDCKFENKSLNIEQKQAIKYAVGVRDVYLIWGPPGTGKTIIVPEIVSNYVRSHLAGDQKILVCSYTNKAVDNVVQKLFDNEKFKDTIVRFGDSTLTGKYKDARFDVQLKKKRDEIEEELKERERQLEREQKGIEEKLRIKREKIEKAEKEKASAKSEIATLNAEITHTKEQITDEERSWVKSNLEKEIDLINGQLQESRDNLEKHQTKKNKLNEEIKELEITISEGKGVISDISGQLNNCDKKERGTTNIIGIIEYYLTFAKGPKQEIEALSTEVSRIRGLIAEKEFSLLNTRFVEDSDQINKKLQNYEVNLTELQQDKEEITKAIARIEREVPMLKRDISGIRELLDKSKKNEPEIANIIYIVNRYLDSTRGNKITSLWKKNRFKRRNPLYEQYKQKINELQLERKNHSELEKILQEKLREHKNEQEAISKRQNDLDALILAISEKEGELKHKKDELIAVEENHMSLLGNIERSKKKLDDLNSDKELLARGELGYDKDALRRDNSELQELYDDLGRKRNKIRGSFGDFTRERQKLPYEQYKQEITELQLARRNCEELESVLQEKSKEQKKEREQITKLQSDLNEREHELIEKERKWIDSQEEQKSFEKNYASLFEQIRGGEQKQEALKRNLGLLARGELGYDRAALIKENKGLGKLYDEIRNKEGIKKRKEVALERFDEEQSFLRAEDEQLRKSVIEINKKIEAEKQKIQRELEERLGNAKLAILNEKQIIATTNLRAYDGLFEKINFDLVIMDEAGAIDLPGAVIPILKGDKYIFLGDPNQLPPVINDTIREIRAFLARNRGLRTSIFQKLYKQEYVGNRAIAIMLRYQYRMKREIADVVSKLYYKGSLRTPIDIEEKLRSIQDDKIVSNRYPMICFPRRFWTEYRNGSVFSENEIRFVRNIIERFKESYGDDIVDDIAIISPYRAQTNRITEEIPKIDCGTVHTFQGQEKRIIIFATAKYRRNRDRSFGELLQGPTSKNLLNVAISRAREKFIIIGAEALFEDVPIYNALYESIHIQSGGYVAQAPITGYDFENRCEMCGKVISEEYRFCEKCLPCSREFLNERLRTFKAFDGDLLRSSNEVRIGDWFDRTTNEYKLYKRVEYLENYINQNRIRMRNPDTAFIATFEVAGMDSIESQLNEMFRKANREIIIVSPWIKISAWNRIEPTIRNFLDNGGKFEVFMKGDDEDFSSGFSDRGVVNEIKSLGSEVKFIPRLHAKVVVIDGQEAIITSANFTSGGLDFNYEGGIWTRNPNIVKDVCGFIDELRNQARSSSSIT